MEIDEITNQSTNIAADPKNNDNLFASYKTALMSFSIARVRKGRPLEQIFWVLGVLVILAFTSYTIYQNSVRFFTHDVRTEVRNIEKVERHLPVVTFCLESTFNENFFCYKNYSLDQGQTKCKKEQSKEATGMYYKEEERWRRGKRIGNDCFVYNENGTVKVATGRQYKIVDIYASQSSTLIVNFKSSEEFKYNKELVYITKINLRIGGYVRIGKGRYDIYIAEKQTTRLPDPYTSSCVDGNVVSTRFSDRYTYDSCQESCAFDYMFKECQDVVNIWKKYRNIDVRPFKNPKYASREKCMEVVAKQVMLEAIPNCTCKSVCKETTYTAEEKYLGSKISGGGNWRLYLYNKDAVTEVNLVPDFPGEQFLGAFGGVLGLGGKFQVIFQMVVFIFLCLGNLRFFRRR